MAMNMLFHSLSPVHPRLPLLNPTDKPNKPRYLFGQLASSLKCSEMKGVLFFYHYAANSRFHTRPRLLHMMGALERELDYIENQRVDRFFGRQGLLGGRDRDEILTGHVREDIEGGIENEDEASGFESGRFRSQVSVELNRQDQIRPSSDDESKAPVSKPISKPKKRKFVTYSDDDDDDEVEEPAPKKRKNSVIDTARIKTLARARKARISAKKVKNEAKARAKEGPAPVSKSMSNSKKRQIVKKEDSDDEVPPPKSKRNSNRRKVTKDVRSGGFGDEEDDHNNDMARIGTFGSFRRPLEFVEEEPVIDETEAEADQSCDVCFENLPSTEFPTRRITGACEHEPTVCLGCLRGHLTTQVHERAWDQIQCPLCPGRLEQLDVRAFATEEDFNRYLDLSLNAVMNAEPDYISCLRPGCGMLQVHEGGEANNIVTCSYCNFKMCFTHQRPMHHGMSCAEFDEAQNALNQENDASVDMIRNTYKFCPGDGCGVPIELRSGCNHMTCNQCQHEFCYECLAPWENIRRTGNTEHAATCVFHTNNLQAPPLNLPEVPPRNRLHNILAAQEEIQREEMEREQLRIDRDFELEQLVAQMVNERRLANERRPARRRRAPQ